MEDSLKVIVDGKEYRLTSQQVNVMEYIKEADAMEKGHVLTINNIDQRQFNFILDIL